MIDHVIVNVRDLAVSRRFYREALAPLGHEIVWDLPEWVGLGPAGRAEFWITRREPVRAETHIAFACEQRSTVEQFHAAALASGGTDNGAPGVRPDYHPDYFSAYVLDPDGNNIEAVCRKPER